MLNIETQDFTIHKFRSLCKMISSNYPTVTMTEYIDKKHPNQFILMRHDVDRIPERALVTARIEQELGIRSTYYFRMVKGMFKPEIIKQVQNMGHEIGYHYETLSDAKGDTEKAIELFRSNLEDLRKISNVQTICMHGSVLSKYKNSELWKIFNFKDFGIKGEAYLSVGSDLNYFTDTGRTWSFKNNLRDYIPGRTERIYADTTDDLINLIVNKKLNNFYISTHPERWPSSAIGWSLWYSADISANLGKKILKKHQTEEQIAKVINKNNLSITIDIEDWYHIPSVCGSPFSAYKDVDHFFKDWNNRYDYLIEPTKRVLNLLDEYDATATFFVVADVANNYPGLIESIVKRGHEIACHGLHHACKIDPKSKKPLITKTEFESRTLEAKKILEDISGKEVIGYRAPNSYVAGWMLNSLENIGFKYDSSVCVNSLYNKTDSSLNGISSYPYYPMENSLEPGRKKDFVEFPLAYYQVGEFKVPTSGGPMLRFFGASMIQKGLEQSLRRGHTIFYWHPIDISYEKFPEIGNRRPMYWAIKGKIVENRIRRILKILRDSNVEFKTLSEARTDILENLRDDYIEYKNPAEVNTNQLKNIHI